MKKQNAGFLIFFIACLFARAENEAVNRIKNPGFEYLQTEEGFPLYWTKADAGSDSAFDNVQNLSHI